MISPESHLHSVAISFVARYGYAPDLSTLGEILEWSNDKCAGVLSRLSEMRGVILKPGTTEIWAIHPFTLMPTPTWVSANGHGWWANCAWCALGIGATLEKDIQVSTKIGAHDSELRFEVSNGQPSDPDLVIHFPFRPSEWWNNPYNPCGCILFFSTESEIDSWCEHHNIPRGEVIGISTGIALANKWFGDYLDPSWTRKTPSQSRELFESLGLTGAFWS